MLSHMTLQGNGLSGAIPAGLNDLVDDNDPATRENSVYLNLDAGAFSNFNDGALSDLKALYERTVDPKKREQFVLVVSSSRPNLPLYRDLCKTLAQGGS
jgi:hypothetical protein